MDREDRTVKYDSVFFTDIQEVSEMAYRCINAVCPGGKLLSFNRELQLQNVVKAKNLQQHHEWQFCPSNAFDVSTVAKF